MTDTKNNSPGIIASPPRLYFGTFIVGLTLHLISPFPILASFTIRGVIGVFLLTISSAFARWAFITMRTVGTSASPYEPSTALTITGPFQISRNPIYVAMTGLYIGFAMLVNSTWLFILLMPLLFLMHHGVILREEHYLALRFGKAYEDYKSEVKRWL